ncbi:MAG TPA: hypothetical protein DCM32_00030 [Xanthomonadaceae bacterium]|nr:hypothetical protein [Xanthomonadaceae bacterium]
MRRLPGLPALALAAALAALPASAEDLVYTWIDRNGVRHYAQTPPDGVRYEVLGVRDRVVGTERPAAPEAAGGGAEAAARAQDQRACERARLALEQLNSDMPLEMDQDGDGTMERITDDQRAQQRRLAEQSVRAFCGTGT